MSFYTWKTDRIEKEIVRAEKDIKELDAQIDALPLDAYFSRICLPKQRWGQVSLVSDLKAELAYRASLPVAPVVVLSELDETELWDF